MANVYFIPGLSNDKNVFNYLNIKSLNPNYIEWLQPNEDEDFKSYAKRLVTQIKHTEDVVLVGFSMGGILAKEISQIYPVKKVVLISSMAFPDEKSVCMKTLKHLPLYKGKLRYFKEKMFPVMAVLFGLKTPLMRQSFYSMIIKFDEQYRIWATNQIVHWENNTPWQVPYERIHGTLDLVFSAHHNNKKTKIVKGGGHFMIMNKTKEVSDFLLNACSI